MKKTAIIILTIFAFSTTAKATAPIYTDYVFEHEKVRLFLRVESRECKFLPLHHKGLAKALNDYIKNKIANGKLENKRFEVQVWSLKWSNECPVPELQLTQGRNGYFVTMNIGRTSWENMRAIVHSFANPYWQPVLLPHPNWWSNHNNFDVATAAIDRKISIFFEQNAISESFEFEPVRVWERDGASLEFTVDGLRYAINGEVLSLFPTHRTLPVRIHDRFLFFQENGIHVVEDMQTVKIFEFDRENVNSWNRDYFRADVHPKWVNIHWIRWDDSSSGIWSYSYEQNRFFSVHPHAYVPRQPVTFGESVVINGVRWATRNVDTPGTFAQNPESAGGFFTWLEARNACPPGWRLPTFEELQSLNDAGSTWCANGRFFGTAPNQIFLLAAGSTNADGMLRSAGWWGGYLSRTQSSVAAWGMQFGSDGVWMSGFGSTAGYSVRCVAE